MTCPVCNLSFEDEPDPGLRPSLHVASISAALEIAHLDRTGEHVGQLLSSESDGIVWISTDSAHPFGITIFGFSDEGVSS